MLWGHNDTPFGRPTLRPPSGHPQANLRAYLVFLVTENCDLYDPCNKELFCAERPTFGTEL
jgi:hypothetical protein